MKNNEKKSIDKLNDQKIDGQNVKGGVVQAMSTLNGVVYCTVDYVNSTTKMTDLQQAFAAAATKDCKTVVIRDSVGQTRTYSF